MRAACALVAERARAVRIETAAIPAYAAALEEAAGEAGDEGAPDPALDIGAADREARAAFAICLDAINFGSGWWPTIRKRPGHSGFFTVAAGVAERFRGGGAWTAPELAAMTPAAVAATLGQDPEHPLMAQFAASLRDVGEHVGGEHGGSFELLVDAAAGSAPALADWAAFADTSVYEGRSVPFFKRAQLAAADVDRADVAALSGLDRLTAFADNLVPHVLRLDGILHLDPALLGPDRSRRADRPRQPRGGRAARRRRPRRRAPRRRHRRPPHPRRPRLTPLEPRPRCPLQGSAATALPHYRVLAR